MPRTLFTILIICFILTACTPATLMPTPTPVPPTATPTPTPAPWDIPGWTLVWQDEFDGDSLNRENWKFDIGGGGWGNQEWQAYTDRPENLRIEEGMLVIEARPEPEFVKGRAYSSARIKTQGLQEFQYGRVEARMKLPHGQGIWPAFWMLGSNFNRKGWPQSGEIDIMEFIGREPDRIHATIHGPGYSGGKITSFVTVDEQALKNDFHVYAMEWDANQFRWYLDGQQYYTVNKADVTGEWVFDQPFFILINLAVGGRWPGYPDDTTELPQFLIVDYVRVYQQPTQ